MRGKIAVVVCALFLAACGGVESADEGVQGDQTIESGRAHAVAFTAGATPEAAAVSGKVQYFGGPVIANVKVVLVLWGSGIDATLVDRLGAFYAAVVASPYYDWLNEYDTPSQKIGRGSFAGAFAIVPKAVGASLSDAQIEAELLSQIARSRLPKADANTLYMIHFPPGVQITLAGAPSCAAGGFCGYHNTLRHGGRTIAYAVLPDMGKGSGCDAGCGAAKATLDLVTSVASEELIEATTDRNVGLAKGLAAPLGWYDAQRGEIGDVCGSRTGKLRAGGSVWTVRKGWSNKANACILSRSGASGTRNAAGPDDD